MFRLLVIIWGLLFFSACNPTITPKTEEGFLNRVSVSGTLSTLDLSASQVSEGSFITLTLELKDTSGAPFTSSSIQFYLTGGTSDGTFGALIDNGDGIYTSTFTGTSWGTATTVNVLVDMSPLTPLTASLIVIAPELKWATENHDFGDVIIGSNSATQTFTLSNIGNDLATGCSAPTLSNTTDFTIVTDNCQTNDLASNGSCTVDLGAHPGTVGAKSTTLSRTCTNGGIISSEANGIVVNGITNQPFVTNVTSSTSDGTIISGSVSIQVTFSQNVTRTGSPRLKLNTNPVRYATYYMGTGTNTLTFRYTTVELDESADLDYLDTSSLELNGGTLKHSTLGLNAILDLPAPGSTGSLGANKDIVVDVPTTPRIVAITGIDGTYYPGEEIFFTIEYSEPVEATASNLTVKIAGISRYAAYISGSGTKFLKHRLIPRASQFDTNGLEIESPLLYSNIRALTGVNADLSFTNKSFSNVKVEQQINATIDEQNYPVEEVNGGLQTINVTVTSAPTVDLVIPVFFGGTATKGTDYTVAQEYVTILAGQTTGTLDYTLVDDAVDESKENIIITLERPLTRSNVILGAENFIHVFILDDDPIKDRWSFISGGDSHACGILAIDGSLYCWGYNHSYRIGDGTSVDKNSPTLIDSGTSYSTVQAYDSHTCGITTAGTLKCWGRSSAALGRGMYPWVYKTPDVTDSGTTYAHLGQGFGYHTCAITTAGVLKCWGENQDAQVGNNTTIDQTIPLIIDSGVSYTQVVTGYDFTCGITAVGVLKCWGDSVVVSSPLPTEIDAGTTYSKISAGFVHVCGLTTAGVLKCWGTNGNKQVGDGTNVTRIVPTVIDSGIAYSNIAMGPRYGCGVTTSNELKCWGSSSHPKLNFVASPTVLKSNITATSIAASGKIFCTVDQDGVALCDSDRNYSEQFLSKLLVPKAIEPKLNSYTKLSVSSSSNCGITSTNKVKCWGKDSHTLGDGESAPNFRTTPVLIDPTETYSQISVSGGGCGITTAGKIKCWGNNTNGALGPIAGFSTTVIYFPVTVDGDTTYQYVSFGGYKTCGITNAGVLKCMGSRTDGLLGDGITSSSRDFSIVDPGVTYQQVSLSGNTTCGITTAGTLKCWGNNGDGNVGDGTKTNVALPTEIDPGATYKYISVSGSSTCGILTSGDLKCWGSGINIGDGTTIEKLFPTLIDSSTSYSQVSVGQFHSCGVTTAGVLKCWGKNVYHQLGDGTSQDRTTPTVIDGGVSYQTVSVGDYHACGITTDGITKCWGNAIRPGTSIFTPQMPDGFNSGSFILGQY